MKEQAFLFYQRWREQMRRLPDSERLQVYDAICDYAFEHKQSNLAYYLESILDNIRLTIKENQAKYDAFLEKQKANGIKGGRPKKNKNNTENPQKPTETHGFFGKPTETQKSHNNKYNNKENIYSTNVESKSTESVDAESAERVEVVRTQDDENKEYCKNVAEYFNKLMQGKQIRQILKLSADRKSHILARTNEYGKEAVAVVIQKAASSSFLNGDNDRGFTATFDWLFKPKNFQKTYEGNYDNRTSIQSQRKADTATSTRQQRDAEWQAYVTKKLYGTNNESTTIPRMLQDSGESDDGIHTR